ncbi:hypothetical protein V2G26_016286 [Clonostachys chloroleuca]
MLSNRWWRPSPAASRWGFRVSTLRFRWPPSPQEKQGIHRGLDRFGSQRFNSLRSRLRRASIAARVGTLGPLVTVLRLTTPLPPYFPCSPRAALWL